MKDFDLDEILGLAREKQNLIEKFLKLTEEQADISKTTITNLS